METAPFSSAWHPTRLQTPLACLPPQPPAPFAFSAVAQVTFGDFPAFICLASLLLEYAIGNAVVARGFSTYLVSGGCPARSDIRQLCQQCLLGPRPAFGSSCWRLKRCIPPSGCHLLAAAALQLMPHALSSALPCIIVRRRACSIWSLVTFGWATTGRAAMRRAASTM